MLTCGNHMLYTPQRTLVIEFEGAGCVVRTSVHVDMVLIQCVQQYRIVVDSSSIQATTASPY